MPTSRFQVQPVSANGRHALHLLPVRRDTNHWQIGKDERHAIRKAVRQSGAITYLELMDLGPVYRQLTCAEMRKRKFSYDLPTDCFYHPRCP